jgi:hypothetical protein
MASNIPLGFVTVSLLKSIMWVWWFVTFGDALCVDLFSVRFHGLKTVHLRHFAAAKIKVLKPYFCPYITLITADQIAQLQERTIALKEYLQIESKRVEIRNLEKTFSPILEQF